MKKRYVLEKYKFTITLIFVTSCLALFMAGCGQKQDMYSVDKKTQFVETQFDSNEQKTNLLAKYVEHFEKNQAGDFDKTGQPAGWWDESNDGKNNAEIEVTGTGAAYITKVSEETWGKVLSDQLIVDLNATNTMRVVINKIDKNTGFKIMVQQPDQAEIQISETGDGAGVHVYNLAEKTGWSGVTTFAIILIVEAEINGVGTLVDEIWITEAINNEAYFCDFHNKAGKPGGWWDASDDKNNNATIKSNGKGSAEVVKAGADVWGKVLSDRLTMDLDIYGTLSVVVNRVAEETGFKLMIQEAGTAEAMTLSENGSGAGVYQYDIRRPDNFQWRSNNLTLGYAYFLQTVQCSPK